VKEKIEVYAVVVMLIVNVAVIKQVVALILVVEIDLKF
jgi:hypothetical protein